MRNGKVALFAAKNGLLGAFAIAMTAAEAMLPVTSMLPPGIRIGMSNIAVMVAAKNVSFVSALLVTVIKSLFVLITRGFTAFLLSLAGGLASAAVIILIFRDKKSRFGCIGAGLVGAEVHNAVQVAVYALLIGKTAFYYLPVLLVFGAASGILTGTVLYFTEKAIDRYAGHRQL